MIKIIISKAKKYILLKDLNINQEIKFKDKEKYNPDQIIALKDFVYNKLIEDSKNDFKGKNKIKKGELNKLIIDYVEKYLVISNGEKVNINK
ncbi:MAG: hypothetical protein RSF67_09085, partial [Clostridia bacterium]